MKNFESCGILSVFGEVLRTIPSCTLARMGVSSNSVTFKFSVSMSDHRIVGQTWVTFGGIDFQKSRFFVRFSNFSRWQQIGSSEAAESYFNVFCVSCVCPISFLHACAHWTTLYCDYIFCLVLCMFFLNSVYVLIRSFALMMRCV